MLSIYRILPLLLILLSTALFATPRVVKVIGVTSTGMSIIVDLGSIDGIRPADMGVFFSEDTIGTRTPLEVAKGEAVKVYSDYSFWSLAKIRDVKQIQKGATLGLICESEVRKGRRKYRIHKSSIVLTPKQNAKDHLQDQKNDFPSEFVRGKGEFVESYNGVTKTNMIKAHDYENTSYFEWVDGELATVDGIEEKVRFKVQKKYPRLKTKKDVERKMRDEIFESYVESAMYQNRDDVIDISRIEKGSSGQFENTFDSYVYHTKKKKEISGLALQKIKRDGPLWSTGMNDHELRRYVIDSGLQSEVKRRERVMKDKLDHEFQFRYSQGVITSAGAAGEKENMTAKHLMLGYEVYLRRVSRSLDRFSFGLHLESGVGYYENNGLNLRAEEFSGRGELAYYFLRPPTTLHKIVPFISMGMKLGFATISNSYLSNSYIYQVRSLPTVNLGLKYRFHAGDEFHDYITMGFGALFVLSYERLELTTAEVLRDENIKESLVKHGIKAHAGLSIYF